MKKKLLKTKRDNEINPEYQNNAISPSLIENTLKKNRNQISKEVIFIFLIKKIKNKKNGNIGIKFNNYYESEGAFKVFILTILL